MTDDQINFYNTEAKKAIATLKINFEIDINELEFQLKIAKCLGYERFDSINIATHNLTTEELLDLYFGKDVIIIRIDLSESILPQGTFGSLYEQIVKSKGEIWDVHKYDSDPLPSNPHAHNKETGHKLHLGNGELYDATNNPLNKSIKKKALLDIRNKIKGIKLPPLTV